MASLDVESATAAYIDGLGADALARAASYTAGNHWLLLAELVVTLLVTWLVIRSGVLDRLAVRLGKRVVLGTFITCVVFLVISSLLFLPYSLYANWAREHSYGLSSQPLADFLLQDLQGTLIGAVFGGLFFLGVYALIRRAGRLWWLWSGGLAAAAIVAVQLLAPTVIMPIFNDYEPLPAGDVRDALELQAAAAGIPADRIFVYDGSRQSNNFTANVAGLGGAARIAISDVALKDASLDEVIAVTGHEIGHYVLGHVWRSVIVLPLLAIILFFVADRTYPWFARRFACEVPLADARSLPVLLFIVSLFSTLTLPINNALTRVGEREADDYSLQTTHLSEALAGALVKTAEYRDPRPHPLQELLFYTHPSVESRVRNAMSYKAQRGGS
ncbi:MAG: M48 family metallopeptidase [Pseudomonadota bacterium]